MLPHSLGFGRIVALVSDGPSGCRNNQIAETVAEIPSAMTVATAAPITPIPSGPMKIGSSRMLNPDPTSINTIETFG